MKRRNNQMGLWVGSNIFFVMVFPFLRRGYDRPCTPSPRLSLWPPIAVIPPFFTYSIFIMLIFHLFPIPALSPSTLHIALLLSWGVTFLRTPLLFSYRCTPFLLPSFLPYITYLYPFFKLLKLKNGYRCLWRMRAHKHTITLPSRRDFVISTFLIIFITFLGPMTTLVTSFYTLSLNR